MHILQQLYVFEHLHPILQTPTSSLCALYSWIKQKLKTAANGARGGLLLTYQSYLVLYTQQGIVAFLGQIKQLVASYQVLQHVFS